ncbi:MAG: TIGR03668 family PPOX class F420-dependent oxidoreductase [Alphaproteobacteria bacterium]|nr:TIGR03668 family PPOX class F420-dependent oxidoreductase [Alphaproteobacteria bacterium]
MAPGSPSLSARERALVESRRVGHLATADATGAPYVVPVCFAVLDDTLYVTIDAKPKRVAGGSLKRLRNIATNPSVAFVADRYHEDWSRLGWVMLRGRAEILDGGAEHERAQTALRARYAQYRAMDLAALPVIALHIARVTSWGDLSAEPPFAS